MEDFSLDASYDAIVCLFSSIGYLPDADALRRTMHTFSDHLAPGGVIVVSPGSRPSSSARSSPPSWSARTAWKSPASRATAWTATS